MALKKTGKAILSWGLAFALAFSCANAVSFFYRSGAGSIPREHAFSNNIRTPNSRIVRGAEGYGVNAVDENGYLNASTLPLKGDYILLMGSSHAEGLQVMQDKTMTSQLNRMLDGEGAKVYNLGTAGYTLPLIIQGFQAALEEFPDTKAVIIEISELSYSSETLLQACNQTEFDPADSGQALVQSQSASRRLRNATLAILPVISLLRQQFESMDFRFRNAFGLQSFFAGLKSEDALAETERDATESKENQTASYARAIDRALALLRAEYSRPIILLYHPGVTLRPDGTLTIDREMDDYEALRAACQHNGITLVDTGDAFLSAYQTEHALPYGFQNTTLGGGHLNALGHRIAAEELYKALQETQEGAGQ